MTYLPNVYVLLRKTRPRQNLLYRRYGSNAHVPRFNAFKPINIRYLLRRRKGSLPTTDDATHLPRMLIPSFSARSRVVKIHNAAPSPMPLAFPAVVSSFPQPGKAGFRLASDSAVTPGRIVSSSSILCPRISMGMISSLKVPVF